MEKQDVKNILMSIRTPENEAQVNNWLGKVDLMSEKEFEEELKKVGNTPDKIKDFFTNILARRNHNQNNQKYPINDFFEYGINGNCVHIHLPMKLGNMMEEMGRHKTMDITNLKLLDAIDKIKKLKENGFYRFEGIDSIYMESPILITSELRFLESLDFETKIFTRKDLMNEENIKKYAKEIQRFTEHFGTGVRRIGTASISFDRVLSQEWEDKKKQKIKEFAEKGIVLEQDVKYKE